MDDQKWVYCEVIGAATSLAEADRLRKLGPEKIYEMYGKSGNAKVNYQRSKFTNEDKRKETNLRNNVLNDRYFAKYKQNYPYKVSDESAMADKAAELSGWSRDYNDGHYVINGRLTKAGLDLINANEMRQGRPTYRSIDDFEAHRDAVWRP